MSEWLYVTINVIRPWRRDRLPKAPPPNITVLGVRISEYEFVGLPGGSVVKNPPANGGDEGSIPRSGRSPGEGNATHSSILAWRSPWTEETGGL